ncbi:MAG: family 16 glycosylhydrolase [Acetobacterium sp.]|uniref:family 16 glycosylhydrolase n=1 Tax=Acetobacterium sp. TaxID=1872094 RepID=UPI003242AAFF
MKIMSVAGLLSVLLFWLVLPDPIHALAATPTALGVGYRGHVQDYGDLPTDNGVITDGGLLGTTGEGKRIEGLTVQLTGAIAATADYNIRYNVHIQNEGWQAATDEPLSWKKDGDFAGSQGKSQRLEAIQLQLTDANGAPVTDYAVEYRVHIQDYGWSQGWKKDGAIAGTAGESKRLEAIQIRIVPKFTGSLDPAVFKTSSHRLGQTQFKPENVAVNDGQLMITIPAGTMASGEVSTTALQGYGSYEISMKLPNAPSSITGFFLYAAPDYAQEIDIEIYNQPDGKIMFTSYANGALTQSLTKNLSFDPTADFHHYRIDYQPDTIDFYVDDILLTRFSEGIPHNPMYLMVNAWFPDWLAKRPAPQTQQLLIDWIRY